MTRLSDLARHFPDVGPASCLACGAVLADFACARCGVFGARPMFHSEDGGKCYSGKEEDFVYDRVRRMMVSRAHPMLAPPIERQNEDSCPVCRSVLEYSINGSLISPYTCAHMICEGCYQDAFAKGQGYACMTCMAAVRVAFSDGDAERTP